jgi:hypothetical protein
MDFVTGLPVTHSPSDSLRCSYGMFESCLLSDSAWDKSVLSPMIGYDKHRLVAIIPVEDCSSQQSVLTR